MASLVEEETEEPAKPEEMETEPPVEEEDEVLILKEGKKEIIVMEIDVDEEDGTGSTSETAEEKSKVVELDEDQSNDAETTTKELPSDKDNLEPSLPMNVNNSSYKILSPPLINVDDEVDENSNSNIPGMFGSTELSTTDGSSIFGFALNSDSSQGFPSPSRQEKDRKVIIYENMKFDFPKIKEEPIEWDSVAEDQVIMTTLEANVSETPMDVDITLDDEDSGPAAPLAVSSPQTRPAKDFDIDLTNEEDDVETAHSNAVFSGIDGNLLFKGIWSD